MYHKDMTAEGHVESTENQDGKEVETLHMEFTNGSLQQLKELATYFNAPSKDPAEVVKLAISFLQNVKDRREEQVAGETEDQ